MAFGLNQIGKPTPATATWVFRVVLYTAAALTIISATITEIPDHVKVIIAKYSSEAVILVHAFSKLFGVPLPNDAGIKAQDISELKTDNPQVVNDKK
jgi:hypothetical protein